MPKVTCSWFHYKDDAPELLHMWLHLDRLGPVRFHTLDHILDLQIDEPHGPYDMDEYGYVTIGDAPESFPLSRFVGQEVVAVHHIRQLSLDTRIGVRLEFQAESVRILAIGDELVVISGLLPERMEADVTIEGPP
ncbi:MAG: hypothetical protein JO362_09505 [Streptomycetaceae bacterium]|nr:hypothetical protein [Streptomycetaceae bacterium]